MKKVEAIITPFEFDEVKEALAHAEVGGIVPAGWWRCENWRSGFGDTVTVAETTLSAAETPL